jgi:hypothetical protein
MLMNATTPCPRCNGTGHYSYNPRYGTVCFGCGGLKVVPARPKGQKAIKPTSEIDVAEVGDIVKIAYVLYRVDAIEEGEFTRMESSPVGRITATYPQKLVLTRLVDDTRCAFLRRLPPPLERVDQHGVRWRRTKRSSTWKQVQGDGS